MQKYGQRELVVSLETSSMACVLLSTESQIDIQCSASDKKTSKWSTGLEKLHTMDRSFQGICDVIDEECVV